MRSGGYAEKKYPKGFQVGKEILDAILIGVMLFSTPVWVRRFNTWFTIQLLPRMGGALPSGSAVTGYNI
jgi:hypothetical protein